MSILKHEKYVEALLKYIYEQKERHGKGEVDWVSYGRDVIICPEPITFLPMLDDYSNNQGACLSAFKQLLKNSGRIQLKEQPGDFWFNTTKYGINLRPGLNNASEPSAIQMGDNAVHGLMAGQTGSGKSAMLNNLIFNLLVEYPPWELDLYLADFKKVEFSRYMNKFVTPHISACAATSEIRYVISMVQYMVDCMNAREALLARLGFQKLADLRDSKEFADYPPIVLPRMLLIVDEFQQLFLDANTKENEQIRNMLTAIVKKGRATGLHILFASQEISHTLSPSDLANFKIRFALNCNVAVSMEVLGNRGAASIKKGSVIFNTSDGTIDMNVRFAVPYVATDVLEEEKYSYFETFLAYLLQFNSLFGFKKPQKFYQEDLQTPFSSKDYQISLFRENHEGKFDYLIEQKPPLSLEDILERIRIYRKELLLHNHKYYDVLTLGDYVTFSNHQYDIHTLFLENGRNKNLLVVSPKTEDLAYFEKLFSYNFCTSPRAEVTKVDYQHIIYSFQPSVRNLFSLEAATDTTSVVTNPDKLYDLQKLLLKKKSLYQLCQEYDSPVEFAIGNYRLNLDTQRRNLSEGQLRRMEDDAVIHFHKMLDDKSIEDIPKLKKQIQFDPNADEADKHFMANLMTFYQYHHNTYEAFPPTIIWIVGIDSLDRIPDWLMMYMKNATDFNLLFIVMANSDFDQLTQIAKCCDYFFVGGNNSRIYDRLQMNYTKKDFDSIAMDLYIKSMEESRSFKKYKCSFGRQHAPSIPFDTLLGGDEDEYD